MIENNLFLEYQSTQHVCTIDIHISNRSLQYFHFIIQNTLYISKKSLYCSMKILINNILTLFIY